MSKERGGENQALGHFQALHKFSPPISASKSRVFLMREIGPGLSPLPFQMWRLESGISPILVKLQLMQNCCLLWDNNHLPLL